MVKEVANSRVNIINTSIGVQITIFVLIWSLAEETVLTNIVLFELGVAFVTLYYSMSAYGNINYQKKVTPWFNTATYLYMTGYTLMFCCLMILIYDKISIFVVPIIALINLLEFNHSRINIMYSEREHILRKRLMRNGYTLLVQAIGGWFVILLYEFEFIS